MAVEVRPACAFDANPIAEGLREADRREIYRATGQTDPFPLILDGIRKSTSAWTAVIDGKPSIIFGVAPMSILTRTGVAWLLATDDVSKIKRKFIRESRSYLDEVSGDFETLKNWVDVENETSIRWLKWLGFEFKDPIPYGMFGKPFYPFEMRLCATR